MFFFLSMLNIPMFVLYSNSTSNNKYLDYSEGLRYFTVGNLAQENPTCGSTAISFEETDEDL
jgi:hypothetical protein